MLQHHMQSFRFPWLLSNVLDAHTGLPLGGAERSRIITWQGVRVGLMGLVEPEWLLTIPSIEESDIRYVDFCETGRQLAAELAADGAELLVALTHMRTPNDLVLAAQVPEIQVSQPARRRGGGRWAVAATRLPLVCIGWHMMPRRRTPACSNPSPPPHTHPCPCTAHTGRPRPPL